jgi:negative regulator of sigma-B (phosphoserine phosphatase)
VGAVIDWGAAGLALDGQTESGDAHLVAPFDGGALVALIDGLGHGSEAAVAARVAIETLAQHVGDAPDALVARCHDALRSTRGAVMTVASFRFADSTVAWVGVGNVDGSLLRSATSPAPTSEALTLRGGIVGHRLPRLDTRVQTVWPGDTLILVTDGIKSGFGDAAATYHPPQEVAERILQRYGRGTDDAHVLVVRFTGAAAIEADVVLLVREESDVAMARKEIRTLAARHALGDPATEALATAASEIARNMLVHAGHGELTLRGVSEGERQGVMVIARDRGVGIADIERAMTDGFSTGTGLGHGLAGARRLVDEFELTSTPGEGTTVILRKWRHR